MARRQRGPRFRVIGIVFAAVVVAFIGFSAVGSLVGNASGNGASTSPVDQFAFQSLDVQYQLSADASGRSVLDTTETFVAQFPDTDQNKGIIRAIPDGYDGHSVQVRVLSVRDAAGDPTPYWVERQNGFTEVLTGTDAYVHGTQTYTIRYLQRDVIHQPLFGGDQEFYWDVNGTGWNQPFGSVRATLTLPASLAGKLSGQTACYQGAQGSTATCEIAKTPDGATASVEQLAPHQNMTIVVGFEKGAFAVPVSWPRVFVWVLLVLAVLVLAAGIVVRVTRLGRPKSRGFIVAQYAAYPGIGVMEAAELLDQRDRAFSALVTELVVSRAATMSQVEGADTKKKGDDVYALTLQDATVLDDEDGDAVHTLFTSLKPGTVVTLDPSEPKIGDRVQKLLSAAERSVRDQGLVARKRTPVSIALLVAAGILAVLSAVLGALLLSGHLGGGVFYLALAVALVMAIAAIVVLVPPERPTEKAVPAYEHLQGIREYLTVAEADRIRMLQSPDGAERKAAPSGQELVQLYERLLPYAILFGIEKEWQKVLGEQYATTPTELTPTMTGYLFASGFTSSFAARSFATTAGTSVASWSGSGGGSSFGGFGGGGFSGGGGGGGGGGGR